MNNLGKLFSIFVFCITLSCHDEGEKTVVVSNEPISVSNTSLTHVEPLNWWVGMKNNTLQLLVNHPKIGFTTPEITYNGVTIKKVHKAKSPNYLFIDLEISEDTKPGKFDIIFKDENDTVETHTYQLLERKNPANDYIGFNSSDAIFLLTPDRFANGDPTNDVVKDLNEVEIDRTDGYARHGGDLQGIIDHVDYISDMGYTAVWPMPVLLNDMFEASYHGYAITDYSQVDPRFGTLEEYQELSLKLKEKGMKLIMDQVANHCGLEHWWMKDLPSEDWVNNQKNYEEHFENWNGETNIVSNHRRTTNQDLYASKRDNQEMTDGWFVSAMPDLNQRNPYMAKYLIQNSIWWIETLNLGGIRQDTYPYSDKNFMRDWAGAIMTEYPNFSIVGEEWSSNPLLVAYWQTGNNNKDGYESNLKSTMDFPMQHAIIDALNQEESWDKGFVKIYEGLANDFVYPTPKDIMIFPDNHDMSRIFTQLNGDIPNTKMALATVLALPRIPQIYYGTEILMNDFDNPGDHGLIRTDFPGGWESDQINAFTAEGLTDNQKNMQEFLKAVLNYRKSSKAIHEGETIHFAPFKGTYCFFRILDDEVVVVIMNKNKEAITLDLERFGELGLQGKQLTNVISNETFEWADSMTLEERGVTILTTKK
ncbi:glycoside hydrolase family 13 protein [Bizionia arctica]|uniref:Neopullulanase SusA n=1 Tax=Bizionia arctica TaxID=1495645 RepID=A0A917LLI3_9FLAO|nr:glycoside hydrolase family 13 protein [Bizionia arctica]GGG40143.1 neopullulanase SusA [Bizionia arctica]